MAIPNHLVVELDAVMFIMHDSFLLYISIGGIESDADEVRSEICQENVVVGWVEAHGLELDVVVDLVGQFEVVHLQA
jgi:hypothetical protein